MTEPLRAVLTPIAAGLYNLGWWNPPRRLSRTWMSVPTYVFANASRTNKIKLRPKYETA